MNILPRIALVATLSALPLATLPACQTSRTAEVPVNKTLETAEQLQMEIDRTDAEVVASLDALDRVKGDEIDQRAAYEQLQRRIQSLKADQQAFNEQAMSLKENARAYEAQWNENLMVMRDPDLRRTAVQRQGDVQESLDAVTRQYRAASEELDPFVREVESIATYLRTDLTPQGVEGDLRRVRLGRGEGPGRPRRLRQASGAALHDDPQARRRRQHVRLVDGQVRPTGG